MARTAVLLPCGGGLSSGVRRIRRERPVWLSRPGRSAGRVLDDLGFNAYNLHLEGLGTGSFYSRREGAFCGFRQGTPEYDRLLSQSLEQVEAHLAANGWLGREYIHWFDEPDPLPERRPS